MQDDLVSEDYSTTAGVRSQIASVGRDLSSTLGELVRAIPGLPRGPIAVAAALGINKDLSHRVVAALRKKDPFAATHLIPGPEPLRRLVKAARRKGVADEIAAPAEQAIKSFEDLIRRVAGDRGGLDAIISVWLPDARERFELLAKQALFRGARQIKGIAAEVVVDTTILHPGTDDPRHDVVGLHAYLGLRRLRPGAAFSAGIRTLTTTTYPGQGLPSTLEGSPIEDRRGVFLDRFCSGPPIELNVHRREHGAFYTLNWGDTVGLGSSRDIVMGELRRRLMRRYRAADDPRTKSGVLVPIQVPSQLCIIDLILHRDVYPDWQPGLRVLETGTMGAADVNDGLRDSDVLQVIERIEPMGWDIHGFRTEEMPNYIELLNYACEKLGWNPSDFRGYRAKIEYPIFGSQVQIAFDLPLEPPESAGG